ncbi:related to WSC2 Glucoamylase III (alpha-1,4-glucan-glucosidase) [Phialocephala subalpina]|uniref:Related to WSC2 Glucoamylase III (Alpha-1,4-glucan-glucosidase) n=1 Tax=Phialocephala subalpina TaxID=576137 RepID=A0A1L7XW60_9HELO|nr:related to WSC2 Glucoamylase III (alpha-1,4-glucan-glucosidase) [Phialocephala subalpina]
MRSQLLQIAFLAIATFATASLDSNGKCDSGFTICSPPGATSATAPQIGDPNFPNLFVDILSSSLPASSRRSLNRLESSPLAVRGTSSLCCNAQTSCLTMANLEIPFCYDKFTTNYLLPDGSTGTVVGGSYTSAGGDIANLETGDYKLANGQTGNIYSSNPSLKPNTATLPMPSQFTASGVGSAIPLSSLGTEIVLTYTTTLPGSTIPASTLPPVTLVGSTSTGTILLPTTTTISAASGSSPSVTVGAVTSLSIVNVEGSTIPGSTVAGSTVPPVTTTIVTTKFSALPVSATAATTSSKKNEGRRVGVGGVVGGAWVGVLAVLIL